MKFSAELQQTSNAAMIFISKTDLTSSTAQVKSSNTILTLSHKRWQLQPMATGKNRYSWRMKVLTQSGKVRTSTEAEMALVFMAGTTAALGRHGPAG